MSALALKTEVERRTGSRVRLYLTDNVSTMISFRIDRHGVLSLRVHRVFAEADLETIRAVAAYVAGKRGSASRRIDWYLESKADHFESARRRRRRTVRLKAEGRHHDLGQMFSRLNRRYFRGTVNAAIGWGRKRRRRARSRIDFGAYYPDAHRIRIHPLLDHPEVPDYFVEFIVYHEMCHAFLAGTLFGRDGCHTPEFLEMERRYHAYERALAWESENLDRFFYR